MIGRTMQHRAVTRGLLGLVLLTVAACGGSSATASPAGSAPGGATPAPKAEEITFWSWVPGIETQIKEFNDSQTAVHVTYVNKGNGNTEYAAFKTALQAGVGIPDAIQIEYQHLPGFIARGQLANLANYGANEAKDKFVSWTWAQVSQGAGVYAYPQDAGPMIMMCNKTVLDQYSIAVPKTWDEFATAAAAIHQANKNVYLTNFTTDQGWFFGMLWQAGAKPFVVNGDKIKIDFTSPEATKVAKYWGDFLKSGNLSPAGTWTSDWNAALTAKQIACWQAGAWGPASISGGAPDTKGQWEVELMPQWTAGGQADGNYGGSTIAVTNASQHQKAADAFARWLTTDPTATLELTGDPGYLFPVQNAVTSNPAWTDTGDAFFGGQKTHQVMAEAMAQVDPSFGWSPFTDFVYTAYADDLVKVQGGKMSFEDLMKDLQARSVQYAQEQGFTVE
jgi:multiple sugar transport system substrate-binding protein